jgi:predicted permease
MVLLVSAGLVLRSLRNVSRGQGFDPRPVVLLRLRPALVAYSPGKARAFQEEVVRRFENLPGVISASPAFYPPLPHSGDTVPAWLPGQVPPEPGGGFRVSSNSVGPRYFETLGVPLLEGRDFGPHDSKGTPAVIVVNETAARHLWPGRDAVGRSLMLSGRLCQVIGVIKDARFLNSPQPPSPFIYRDYWQQDAIDSEPIDSRMHVRVRGDSARVLQSLRSEIAAIDPNVPVSEDRPLTEWLDYRFLPLRAADSLLTSFAALALLLSAIGIYGILAFSVDRRRREFGIRMTLGAERRDVSKLVVRQGAGLALLGIAGGTVGALGAARTLTTLLYGIQVYDPVAMTVAPLILLGAALLASYVPARRATRVDPMVALRSE